MLRLLGSLLLLAATAQATDVFVPPVLKGVKGEAKGRRDRPVPFPAADEEWTLVRSRHFLFISSAGERRARDVAEDLETLAAALGQLNPQFRTDIQAPTRVFLFSRRGEAQPYFDLLLDRDHANVAGVYVSQKQGGSMLMNLSLGWRQDRTPFHELVHNLIANSGASPPLWLDEGLAEYFSNAEVRKGSLHAGGPVMPHVDSLRRHDNIPLQKLFAVVRESDAYNFPAGQHAFYAESWALVDWLIRTAGSHPATFWDFLHDVNSGVPVEAALRSRYGKSLADMQHGLDAYSGFGYSNFSLTTAVANVDTATSTTPLDRAGILFELGQFLTGVASTGSEPERHFRAALEANPKHARSMAAIGGLRAGEGRYDEAAGFFEQAVAADPNDAEIHLAYAEALMQTQIGALAEANEVRDEDTPRFRKARELTLKAIALTRQETARAYGDLGTTYIVEEDSDLAPGIAALEKARALAPGRLDYAIHLFAMDRRIGDRARADPLFAILDGARNPQVSYAARAVIMRVELGRANDLVREQKLSEAAAVIRSLAAETPDGDAKADLDRQASEIVRVAEQNRQIEAYNKAIGEVKRGDYRAAMKTLKELLGTATDPSVIRDAQKLQKQLAARVKS